ncbi:CPBP family intramembrane metalloprotease [Candidatus Kaiserbacteria bacterium]|nr:CPBP family intramembrane metalloprotease [Candidatus Kaiserbacteria bacterium]
METFARWLAAPPAGRSALGLWLGFAILVFVIWLGVPALLGVRFPVEYLAVPLSLKNLAVMASTSFGEEFVFRVLPVMTVLYLFPGRTVWALLAAIVVAYPFGMWHDWLFTAKTCLGLGGIVLAFAYVKFGGASGKPFNGFLACGGIHAACNLVVAVAAHIVLAWSPSVS